MLHSAHRFGFSSFLFIALAACTQANPILSSADFSASSVIINFDDLSGGDGNLAGPSVTTQYAALGVTFNNPSYPGEDTADTNLVGLIPLASAPNTLYVYQGGMIGQTTADPFQILFSVPVTAAGFNYASSISSYLLISAYGADNQLLETATFVGDSAPIGLEGFAGLSETSPIARLDVSYIPTYDDTRTFSFSLDNLQFDVATPEPIPLTLVGAGLIGIGLLRRKQKAPGH